MPRLPTVITTSVIRSAHQGDSHGGIYLVDLESGDVDHVVDWNDPDINWEGRGMDRGLRGIAFYNDELYIAASDEIFVYDTNFKIVRSFRNRYLKHCHETFMHRDKLYITSTGYDSVLEFDLQQERFTRGFCIRRVKKRGLTFRVFDPNSDDGPKRNDTVHLNYVFCKGETIYVAGVRLRFLFVIEGNGTRRWGKIPEGSHNARPFRGNVLLNDTAAERAAILTPDGDCRKSFPVRRYDESLLLNPDLPRGHARQGFTRGLCLFGNNRYVAIGSSPSTIFVYRIADQTLIREINLTMDIRNSIHGLEVWPFS